MYLIFWVSAAMVVYPYLIYPLILFIGNRIRNDTDFPNEDIVPLPSVTLVISAFNEAKVIGRKIENSAAIDYPEQKIRIVVVSDASDDGTDDIVREKISRYKNVKLFRQNERLGKTAGINAVMETIDSDVVVFSDANAMYEPNAISELVRPFSDPGVGYVVGTAQYRDQQSQSAAQSEGLYWKYELAVKYLESRFFSVVGGDGAIYGIRRHLFWPFSHDDINDFVNPLQIVAHGYRGEFSNSARCFEDASDTFHKEFKRKRRIVNRSWRAVKRYWYLFKFPEHAKFMFMLVSHKVIRWFALPLIVLSGVSCGFILVTNSSYLYLFFFTCIVLSVMLAFIGKLLDDKGVELPFYLSIPYYFYWVNYASLLGIWDNWQGKTYSVWGHIRS